MRGALKGYACLFGQSAGLFLDICRHSVQKSGRFLDRIRFVRFGCNHTSTQPLLNGLTGKAVELCRLNSVSSYRRAGLRLVGVYELLMPAMR